MRSTTAWILQREPRLIRIAPLIILLFVAGLAGWSAYAKIPVYGNLPARVIAIERSQTDTLFVHIDTTARLETGLMVIVSPIGIAGRGINGSIVDIEHWENVGAQRVAAAIAVPGASRLSPGPVVVRVQVDEHSVISELFGATGMRRNGR